MTLKVKFRTQFPASVLVQSPILLDKTGAVYTFSIDVTALQATFSNLFQPVDATLTALAALNSTAGLLTQTGVEAFTKRTLTGTAAEITVTNGDGAAGAPTFSLPAALTFTGKTVTGGTYSGAVSYNKVVITAPATSATLTLIDGTTLTGPAASGTVMTLGNVETVTGVKTFGSAGAVGKLAVAGNTSGSTVLNATAVASGTVTLPAATDTLVGKATTDTFTNKTFDTAGTGNSFSINGVAATANTGTGAVARAAGPTFTTPTLGAGSATSIAFSSTSGVIGTTTNDSAAAGSVGELISSTVAIGSAVSLTTGTPANITSVSLTAGDWDVTTDYNFTGNAATTVTNLSGSISPTSATLTATAGNYTVNNFTSFTAFSANNTFVLKGGPVRVSLSGTTSYFAVAQAAFATNTCSVYGQIRARRVR